MITWLADGGFRIGELCGLHLADLHLRDGAGCGECRPAHVHVCHRPGNPNKAAAKAKAEWAVEAGTVRGGLIKRASPAMIHAYFEYMTTEYPTRAGRGMLLVQLHGAEERETEREIRKAAKAHDGACQQIVAGKMPAGSSLLQILTEVVLHRGGGGNADALRLAWRWLAEAVPCPRRPPTTTLPATN